MTDETLEKRIAQGPIEPNEVVSIAIQLCSTLRDTHTAGAAHRDIRPANIVTSAEGTAVFVDFRTGDSEGETEPTCDATTAETSTYMSPEQVRGEPTDQRTDIWSLGVVLYEMLTGWVPFKADDEATTLYSIINEDARPIAASHPNVPAKLEKIVLKALAKRPSERYQNIDALLADLEVFAGVQAGAVTPISVELGVEERGRRRLYRMLGVVVIFVIAGVIVWLWPRSI